MAERSVRITSDWEARYVKPGTPYRDEPSEMIPAGWYVLGGRRSGDEEERGLDVIIHIEQAYDVDGEPIGQQAAELIAEAMRNATAVRR